MNCSIRYNDEKYTCLDCKKDLKLKDLDKDIIGYLWKCPFCNGQLYVKPATEESNYVYVRKYAPDLEENDIIQMGSEIYNIKGVTKKNNLYYVGLEQYGSIKLKEDDWVNCVFGSNI